MDSKDLQDLPQDSGNHKDLTGEDQGKDRGGAVQRIPSFPRVPEDAEGKGEELPFEQQQQPPVSQRQIRKIKHALKQAISFWGQIRDVFVTSGMDDDTISNSLAKLNHEVMTEISQHPRGTKKTRQIAEVMNLNRKQLRTIAEIYNPACFGKLADKRQLIRGMAFDLTLGFDLLEKSNQTTVVNYLRTVKPGLVMIAPPCELYSQLQNLGKLQRLKNPELMRKYLKRRRTADKLLQFAIDVAMLCRELGLTFVLEHPWSATSWTTKMMTKLLECEDVWISRCDQCMFGLCSTSGLPHRKRTGLRRTTSN